MTTNKQYSTTMTMAPSASLVIDELKFEIKNSDSSDKQ